MATSPIFRPLDTNQRRTLIEKFKSREVGANEKLLEEGEKGDGLYMLLAGRARGSAKRSTASDRSWPTSKRVMSSARCRCSPTTR